MGKRDKVMPIVLNDRQVKNVGFLIEHRAEVGIDDQNQYIFTNWDPVLLARGSCDRFFCQQSWFRTSKTNDIYDIQESTTAAASSSEGDKPTSTSAGRAHGASMSAAGAKRAWIQNEKPETNPDDPNSTGSTSTKRRTVHLRRRKRGKESLL